MDFQEVSKALRTPPILGWSRMLIWRGMISAFAGLLLGMITSLIVNVALVEISISPFFALYFGFLFIVTGGVIAWRILSSPIPDEDSRSRKKILLGLAFLVSASGILCCTIQRSWFYNLPKILKVSIYTILGIAISFAQIFSAIDLINVGFGLCQVTTARSPVESTIQVSLIVSVALFMGCIFGFMFGLLDVPDEITYHVRLSLLREEQFCYPIGGALGALAGFANEYLRNQEEGYIRLKRAEYDADI